MKSLFADTTSNLTIGILDENWHWLAYEHTETVKTSNLIHANVHKMLTEKNIAKEEIDRFIYIAGPGSYTGMRVAEGIAQIFSWQDIKINSFYHFEVPSYIGESEYTWYANAYKRELFLYLKDKSAEEKKLLATSDWESFSKQYNHPLYTYADSIKMIHERPEQIFSDVVEKDIRKELFYFRNIEDEFKRANK